MFSLETYTNTYKKKHKAHKLHPNFPTSYCWWLKSCTTWDVWNPINNGDIYHYQLVLCNHRPSLQPNERPIHGEYRRSPPRECRFEWSLSTRECGATFIWLGQVIGDVTRWRSGFSLSGDVSRCFVEKFPAIFHEWIPRSDSIWTFFNIFWEKVWVVSNIMFDGKCLPQKMLLGGGSWHVFRVQWFV